MDRKPRHLDFTTFSLAHANAHLVAGAILDEPRTVDLANLRRLLRRFIETLDIGGDYATGLVRTADTTEIQCWFSSAAGAQAFAAWCDARPTERYTGFETQRCFVIDASFAAALKSAVAPSPTGRRPGRPRRT